MSVSGRLMAAGGLVALATVIGAYYLTPWNRDAKQYRTALVERGTIVTTVTATGTINAVVTTKVSSQLSGQVAELLVDYNDPVRQGQVLARLDPQSFDAAIREARADLEMARAEVLVREAATEKAAAELVNARAFQAAAEAELASAEAEFKEAERELGRRRALAKNALVSASDIEQAETRHASTRAQRRAAEARLEVRKAAILAAEAALKMADADVRNARAVVQKRQANLDQAQVERMRAEICAPIEGIVIRRDVDVGTTVAASLQAPTLFTIAQDLSEVQVEAKVDEADIGLIRTGQPVVFTVDAYPARQFEGGVQQIRKAHEMFQNVVTYAVIVSALNRDLALFPGMTAVVRITVSEAKDVLKVPVAALRYVPEGRQAPLAAAMMDVDGPGVPGVVWVLDERQEPRPLAVRTGTSDSYFSAVVSGPLQPGATVIVGEIRKPGKRGWLTAR